MVEVISGEPEGHKRGQYAYRVGMQSMNDVGNERHV